jgi:hypothetical protein
MAAICLSFGGAGLGPRQWLFALGQGAAVLGGLTGAVVLADRIAAPRYRTLTWGAALLAPLGALAAWALRYEPALGAGILIVAGATGCGLGWASRKADRALRRLPVVGAVLGGLGGVALAFVEWEWLGAEFPVGPLTVSKGLLVGAAVGALFGVVLRLGLHSERRVLPVAGALLGAVLGGAKILTDAAELQASTTLSNSTVGRAFLLGAALGGLFGLALTMGLHLERRRLEDEGVLPRADVPIDGTAAECPGPESPDEAGSVSDLPSPTSAASAEEGTDGSDR